jgi:zinc protease
LFGTNLQVNEQITHRSIMIKRNIAPPYQEIKGINIPPPRLVHLGNGLPVYLIEGGDQGILKIDLFFNAGSKYQSRTLTAFSVNNMIQEGTNRHSSTEIANILDFHGSYLQLNVDKDMASVGLLSLTKHIDQTLPLLEEMIKRPIFPVDELSSFLQRHRQQYIVENSKVKNMARLLFMEKIYGAKHPYGLRAEMEDFERLDRDSLSDFHTLHYHGHNAYAILSGKADDTALKLFDRYFGNESWINNKALMPQLPSPLGTTGEHVVEKAGSVQSAIRVGRLLFNRNHPDYNGLMVLNCLLGGYFGSRLMKNIREDKGYTYGISSLLVSLQDSGFWVIVSEVGASVTRPALEEIYREMHRLRDETVEEEELSRVKSYMLGELLRGFDGPFAQADNLANVLDNSLDMTYYENLAIEIQHLSAEQIQELAKKYLDPRDFITIIAGKPDN